MDFRKQLRGVSAQRPSTERGVTVKLTAYADDVTVVVRDEGDVKRISECLGKFQEATSARINWSKSTALLLGQWLQESPPRLPQQCSWNLEGFKVLGVCRRTGTG